jgi:dienelactone hydrolase
MTALAAGLISAFSATPSAASNPRPSQFSRQIAHGVEPASQHRRHAVIVQDVMIAVRHQEPIAAYVVRPIGRHRAHSQAGILFLHWLGQIHNDRTEYLAEATELASRGVVSVLPQGYFPWVPNPDGTTNDMRLVKNQVAAFHAALNRLVDIRSVDRSRVAIVGHDYGAMYGALVADGDRRVSTLVLEAPDSLWGNWFAKYWLGLEGADRDAYLQLFAGLDPVEHTARLGSHVLFQWAGEDVFIDADVRAAFAASSPHAQVELYDRADHQLTDEAQIDRDAFLARELQLTDS